MPVEEVQEVPKCPMCNTCGDGDEECMEANAECVSAAEACETEAACLEGDHDCIAAVRGGYWGPMTGHIDKNPKDYELLPRPQQQHAHAHKWHLPGVNVDSGWTPYKKEAVWGYDRRPGAKSPGVQVGGQDTPVEFTPQTGLLSASQDVPKEEWGHMDRIEHSDHTRAMDSLQHLWHSVADGEGKSEQASHASEQASHASQHMPGQEPLDHQGIEAQHAMVCCDFLFSFPYALNHASSILSFLCALDTRTGSLF